MISNTYANKLLRFMCGIEEVDIVCPKYVYLGLCEFEPTATDGTIKGEPDKDSYKRVLVGGQKQTKYFGDADAGKISNNTEIQFKTAREDWGTMYYFFLSDYSYRNGKAIMWGKIKNKDGGYGVEINGDTVPTFYEGQLTISIDEKPEQQEPAE